MSYNGWSNYETWNIPLWMSNEYGIYREVENQKEFFLNQAMRLVTDLDEIEDAIERAKEGFADWYQKTVTDLVNADNGMFDITSDDLHLVDWDEIIESEFDEITIESVAVDYGIEEEDESAELSVNSLDDEFTEDETTVHYHVSMAGYLPLDFGELSFNSDYERYERASELRTELFISMSDTHEVPETRYFVHAIKELIGVRLTGKGQHTLDYVVMFHEEGENDV